MGHWHQSHDCCPRVPAQHSLTPLLTDMHHTTNCWLCSHHESLSHQQERPSSFPSSFSPLQHLYFYAQTALPHRWLRPLTTRKATASHPKFQTWKPLLRAFLKHRHSSPATPQAAPRARLHLSSALGAECEGHGLPEPPSTLLSQVLRLLQRTQG